MRVSTGRVTYRLVVTGECYIALICNSAQDLGDGRQCDNTSRPGFRIDPPFEWETAHEAYFGAVASAQDLLEVTPVSPDNLEETGSDLPYGRPG